MIGEILNGRYRLDLEVGRGGMGTIYRAHDQLLDRTVAVKVLSNAAVGTKGRARLLHEARAAAKLNHPNIVTVYDAGEASLADDPESQISFIVMEYVEGHSLHSYKPVSMEEIYAIAIQICAALAHAHAHGIIHRDLKPENVLITPDINAKLTDFGLARSTASRVTEDGMLVGTVFYLAPEMALGQQVDARSDLYALGVLLYELVAGKLPFTAEDPLAVVAQHIHATVVPPSTYNSNLHPAFDALIVKMLSKNPQDRPAGASEVQQTLEDLAAGKTAIPANFTEVPLLSQLARGRLVDREREIASIKTLWKQIIAGVAEEHVIFITGEEGIGKTPLVSEITALAKVSGGEVLSSNFYSEGNVPYAPFAQMIREVLSERQLDLPDQVKADLISLAPEAAGNRSLASFNPHLDPQAQQQRLFESMVVFCTALAAANPLVIAIEDLHWADASTLRLIRHLARRSRALRAQLKILFILTYREEDADKTCCLQDLLMDLNRERLAIWLRLERFNRQQTGQLLSSMFQQEPTGEFLDSIYRVTEGNQFFIEEICKSLIEEGKLIRSEGRWQRLQSMEKIALPQSIRMVIQARLDKLPAQAQDILRLAAIIGREFEFDVLQKASELAEDPLIEALEAATTAQLISEVRGNPSNLVGGKIVFIFAHGLVPAVLRESVSALRLGRLHRRVAEAIEALHPDDCESLAFHYSRTSDTPRALEYTLRAGDRSLSVFSNQEAEHYFDRALTMDPGELDRASILSGKGEATFREAHYLEAIELWQEAVGIYRELDDLDNAARLIARMARSAWFVPDPARGLEICLSGLAEIKAAVSAPDQLEAPGMAALLHETARAYRFNNGPKEALELCRQALSLAKRLDLVDVQAETLATLGILPNISAEEALQALSEAVKISDSAGLLITAIRAHENLSDLLRNMGDFNAARAQNTRAYEIAHQIGVIPWEHTQLTHITELTLFLGDFEFVEGAIQRLHRLEDVLMSPWHTMNGRVVEARLLYFRGEFEKSAALMRECRLESQKLGDTEATAKIDVTLGEILRGFSQFEEARSILEEAIKISDENLSLDPIFPRLLLSGVYLGLGQIEDARRLLAEAKKLYERQPFALDLARITRNEATLEKVEGHYDRALELYENVVGQVKKMGAEWYLGMLLLEWADVYAARCRADDYKRARKLLLESQTVFKRLGMPRWVSLVSERLSAS